MAKVLIADDEVVIRDLLADIVTYAGHEAIKADNGIAAFETASSERPEVILLDIMMPGMNGIEVLQRLKTDPATLSIPVIMVTAKSQPRHEMDALRAGAWDYITKPLVPQEIEERIRMALTHLEAG